MTRLVDPARPQDWPPHSGRLDPLGSAKAACGVFLLQDVGNAYTTTVPGGTGHTNPDIQLINWYLADYIKGFPYF